MSYVMMIVQAGATLEVEKRHCRRYPPPGTKRQEKTKETTKAQEQVNIRNAERRVRWLMNENFGPGDLYLTFDYAPASRPEDGEGLKRHGEKLKRDLRRLYQKKGMALKYIYTMERGSKGAMHHHILIQDGATVQELRKIWPYGRVHIKPLDDTGQYRKLAAYFIKYAVKTRNTDRRLMRRYYDSSKNLRMPVIRKIIVRRKTFRKEPAMKKGYWLDKDTEQHYIDRNGFEVMRYTLVKLQI